MEESFTKHRMVPKVVYSAVLHGLMQPFYALDPCNYVLCSWCFFMGQRKVVFIFSPSESTIFKSTFKIRITSAIKY